MCRSGFMSCSCVVSLDKNFDSFHSVQVHVWVPATHHTAGGNPVRGWGRGGGQQCSNIPIHLGLSCYWNRNKLPTVQASIAQVRFYQRGNIGRDSTKRCTLVSLQHLFVPTSPTQTSHGTSEINHDTRVFQPPHFSNNVRGLFTSPLPDM